MKYLVVLVTTPDRKTSEKLSRGLVAHQMAACVNIVPGVRSRYRWKGKVETAREELLLIKTGRSKLSALTRWVRENHPYTVCEVVALPIRGGSEAYLDWIAASLA
ncbi:MAG TPA: divalent-cation tolerance protein CutA [bacterium]|nr:divalent-cation tolerance protein CutA [bacterium]